MQRYGYGITLSLQKNMAPPLPDNDKTKFHQGFDGFPAEITGSSGTCNINLYDLTEHSRLLPGDLKHKFNGFPDVGKSLFLCVTFTYGRREFQTACGVSSLFRNLKDYCILHSYSSAVLIYLICG